MPWIRDVEFNRDAGQRYQEPARVQLILCGQKIFEQATIRDYEIERWLSLPVKLPIAG